MLTDLQLLTFFITIIWLILSVIAYDENDALLCAIQMILGFFIFFQYMGMDLMHSSGIFYYVFPISILFWSFTVLTYGVIGYRNRNKPK